MAGVREACQEQGKKKEAESEERVPGYVGSKLMATIWPFDTAHGLANMCDCVVQLKELYRDVGFSMLLDKAMYDHV